jgi:hypothetical protein
VAISAINSFDCIDHVRLIKNFSALDTLESATVATNYVVAT